MEASRRSGYVLLCTLPFLAGHLGVITTILSLFNGGAKAPFFLWESQLAGSMSARALGGGDCHGLQASLAMTREKREWLLAMTREGVAPVGCV